MIKYSLQKEANLINQKYTTQETAAENIKNQLKSSIENEMIEALRRKPVHRQFYQDIARPSVDKEKSLVWLYCSGFRRSSDFNNNRSPRSSTQYALSSEEHLEATN